MKSKKAIWLPALAYAVINDGVGGGQLQGEPVDFLLLSGAGGVRCVKKLRI